MIDDLTVAMMTGTSPAVQFWMGWMVLIMTASLLFIWKHKGARWSFIGFLIIGVIALLIWNQTKNIHLFGIGHLIIWTPLVVYLYKTVISETARKMAPIGKPYFIWACLAFATMFISLIFDVRDLLLIVLGMK